MIGNKDKGKKSQQARMNISRALKGKAKRLRGKTENAARKGIIKASGAVGYGLGRAAGEIDKRPSVSKVVAKGIDAVSKAKDSLPVKTKVDLKIKGARNKVTKTRAKGSFVTKAAEGYKDGRF